MMYRVFNGSFLRNIGDFYEYIANQEGEGYYCYYYRLEQYLGPFYVIDGNLEDQVFKLLVRYLLRYFMELPVDNVL